MVEPLRRSQPRHQHRRQESTHTYHLSRIHQFQRQLTVQAYRQMEVKLLLTKALISSHTRTTISARTSTSTTTPTTSALLSRTPLEADILTNLQRAPIPMEHKLNTVLALQHTLLSRLDRLLHTVTINLLLSLLRNISLTRTQWCLTRVTWTQK